MAQGKLNSYLDLEHPVVVTKVLLPDPAKIKPVSIIGNKVLFWFWWKYGLLTFPRWTAWLKPDNKIGIIKYVAFSPKNNYRMPIVRAPYHFWRYLAMQIGEVNPVGMTKLEFLTKCDLPQFFNSNEEAVELVKANMDDKNELPENHITII